MRLQVNPKRLSPDGTPINEWQNDRSQCMLDRRGGDVAQLGERYNRTVEVGGSNPPVSTTKIT